MNSEYPSNEDIVKGVHVLKRAGIELTELGVMTNVTAELLLNAVTATMHLLRGPDKFKMAHDLSLDLQAEAHAGRTMDDIERFANGEQPEA